MRKRVKIPSKLIVFTFLLAAILVLFMTKTAKNNLSETAMYPKVAFEGEYCIKDGPWEPIVHGEHIPATKGNVTLRGNFHMVSPQGDYIGPLEKGIPIAFFLDHINLSVYEEGQEPYVMDVENSMIGVSSCGQCWVSYSIMGESDKDVELVFQNPHIFGNDTAIDEWMGNLSTWLGIEFEKDIMCLGNLQKYSGILFIVVAMIILGTALFTTLFRLTNSEFIWLTGGAVVCAGVYSIYSEKSIYFLNGDITANTVVLGCSMICYMLFILMIMTALLDTQKRIGNITVAILGILDAVIVLISSVFDIRFFDTWLYWALIQSIANIIMLRCFYQEYSIRGEETKWTYLGISLPLLAFGTDFMATASGEWSGGRISKYMFIAMFFVALIIILQIIPRSVLASMRAKELEAEKNALDVQLAQSRISTMISQIRPHFIYNTLGSIEQLCELNPPKAAELVHNFAKYLRGNFSELDNPKTIPMTQEMKHVKYYISIEKVRFPDMEFVFEMNSGDFELPALTVQPIVENAIKHGLMKLQKGGVVYIKSFETESHYCVSVEDDGAGFDTNILYDERMHIGLRNIRGRLEAMVSGTLEIESQVGIGTKVLIKIPKEISE